MTTENYNPLSIVRAVEVLQPLGKEKVLSRVIRHLEFKRGVSDYIGLFCLLRVLFDVPKRHQFPPVRIGCPSLPPPEHIESFPRFPIIILKDIPLLVVRGYTLGGTPEQVESHVTYFRYHGILREGSLVPAFSYSDVEEAFLNEWKIAYGSLQVEGVREFVKLQILRMTND